MIIDERERKSGIPDLLREVGVKVEMTNLPIGDYIVAPETVVERKSVYDFISSVFDGRLFDQCNRLKEHFEHPTIIIEGNLDKIDQITENPLVFYGSVSSVVLDFKIPVVPTPNASHTAKLLISMCARQGSIKGPFLKKILYKLSVTSLCGFSQALRPIMLPFLNKILNKIHVSTHTGTAGTSDPTEGATPR